MKENPDLQLDNTCGCGGCTCKEAPDTRESLYEMLIEL
jgi:hypothetical protein